MERVRRLMEELLEAVREVYPEMTFADIQLDIDGFRNIEVIKWNREYNKPVDKWKRRILLDQSRSYTNSPWAEDKSGERNQYLLEKKVLLEG